MAAAVHESSFCVVRGTLEFNEHSRIVTDDPRIMSGSDPIDLSCSYVAAASVLMLDAEPSRHHIPNVLDLTALGLDNRLDAF
jgi:hypothetical protein